MRRIAPAVLALLTALSLAFPAAAHETTRSYLTLDRDGPAISARLAIAFRDAEVAVWMDENLDGRITWAETTARLDAVTAYVASRIELDAGGPCRLARDGADAFSNSGVDYLQLDLSAACPDAEAPLTLRTRLFLDIDPEHRMFVTARDGARTSEAVLGGTSREVTLDAARSGAWAAFSDYLRDGVEHLLAGTDHIVFLLALILPAAVMAGRGRRGDGTVARATLAVLAAVTGFTLGHALSLGAAAFQVLRPPVALVEFLIALTIVLTALDNVWPFLPRRRAVTAALFGVIHGFGFASALGVLDLAAGGLATALLGFNLGIELGQAAVVVLVLPVLALLPGGRIVLYAGSAGCAAAGLIWMAQRLPV